MNADVVGWIKEDSNIFAEGVIGALLAMDGISNIRW
jgi:hypothetical protein